MIKFNPITGELDLVNKNILVKKSDQILSGTTKTVDTVPLSSFKTIDYSLAISSEANGAYKGLKMMATKTDLSIKDQVYSRNGGPLNITVNVIRGLSNATLEISNGEAFDVDLILTRALL